MIDELVCELCGDYTHTCMLVANLQKINQKVDVCPSVDLFASHLNTQLPWFVSWLPDPLAWHIDAFTIDWKNLEAYLFEPFALLTKCLQKILIDKATVLLIAPVWKTQPWYPLLLQLSVKTPVLLPRQPELLRLRHNGQHHAMWNTMQLPAWRLSGSPYQQEAFRSRCPTSFCYHGVGEPTPNSIQHGIDGTAGVFTNTLILFEHP